MREWLRNIRVAQKLTQNHVAKEVNISRSYYTHIENGTKTPTVEIAKKLGQCLGFNWTRFYDDDDSQTDCSQKEQSA